ncbi:MAG: D-aminoacyl-tRNA deacylase [Candidatus Hadarchaeales archaeon]
MTSRERTWVSRLLLAPLEDPAAQNICRHLLKSYPFQKRGEVYYYGKLALLFSEENPLEMRFLPFPVEEVIILSRHVSISGVPTLSVHVPGEPQREKLAFAKPETVGSILRSLQEAKEEMNLPHQVCLEATHHGPTDLSVPVTFVEIGSTREEWTKEEAGKAVAKAVLSPPGECLRAIGVGGPHYAPRHTETVLKTKYWIGHLLPKYVTFTEGLLKQALSRTQGGADLVLSDEDGLNSEQKKIVSETCRKLGVTKLTVKRSLSQKL